MPHQVVIEDIHPAIVIKILDVSTHGRYGCSRVIVGNAVKQTRFFKCAVPLIQVEKVGLGIVGDKNVHPSVIVEICNADSHPLAQRFAESGLLGNILEPATAHVVVKPMGNADVSLRVTVDFDLAVRTSLVRLGGPDGVV